MIFRRKKSQFPALCGSKLLNDNTFYSALLTDLRSCRTEVVIESPFITCRRVNRLMPIFRDLRRRGVTIVINTRELEEHDDYMRYESGQATAVLQNIGVKVLYTAGHHRKLVILDRRVLYEGSLNALSQNTSCEIMRRIESKQLAEEMIEFIQLQEFLA